jgi:hypothetical protein
MKVNVTKTSLRTIKQGDPKFMLTDGMVTAPRAGFEISQRCPESYKKLLLECIDCGWLKPVAIVMDNELFWEEFKK